ncbi:hypothetical protein Bxe_A0068 [Paraburkholderia xenovorans LB400]|uniref:Uncharacterized protein n=1 Tax=Paraburkholderia xenovorans (strain LB400) TaxID=266265 RepID=Q13SS9_PARXL|nr:hypothetical protein Bxe_A0068 [Paraburkholderia xenovorans LB400]
MISEELAPYHPLRASSMNSSSCPQTILPDESVFMNSRKANLPTPSVSVKAMEGSCRLTASRNAGCSPVKLNSVANFFPLGLRVVYQHWRLDAVAKLSFGSVNFSGLVLTFCLVLPDRKRCLKN